MTETPLAAVQATLIQAGYRDLRTPLRVAGVDFQFTGAMRGSDGRGLDLVVLVDTTIGAHGDRDATRIRQRVEGLSRALDVTGSRLVLTAILVGAAPAGNLDTLSEICRVLRVEPPEHAQGIYAAAAAAQLEDCIRVLLPLSIPAADGAGETGSAVEQLRRALPAGRDPRVADRVIEASREGTAAVTTAIAELIDGELHTAPRVNQAAGDAA